MNILNCNNSLFPDFINKEQSILDYLCSIYQEADKTYHHFYKLYGEEIDVNSLAEEKANELNGKFLITKNYSKTSIHVVIVCNNDDWKSKINDPIISSTLRRQNAQ